MSDFASGEDLARFAFEWGAGQSTATLTHALRAAKIARQSFMDAVEMRALHTALRFDDRSHTARLIELAKTLNTPLAEATAERVHGLANRDADLLDAAPTRRANTHEQASAAGRYGHRCGRTGPKAADDRPRTGDREPDGGRPVQPSDR